MGRKPTGNPNGRPLKKIDRAHFEYLCNLQCTLVEIAGFFHCCEDTIESWCKKEYGMTFSETYKIYSQAGKISLRRYQYKQAEHNPTMAIWLGKQWLNQAEKIEQTTSFEDITVLADLLKLDDDKDK